MPEIAAKPKVSILVPIFNVERYLNECLESIVHQTLEDIEIICINDGSTDASLDIIKSYAKNDKRIFVINKENSGYGDSMNRGIAKARGEYIGIVESDDFAELDMFEKLYALAREQDAEVAKSNFFFYYSDLSEKSPQWDAELDAVYDKDNRRIIRQHNTLCRIVNDAEVNRLIDPRIDQHIFYQKPSIWSAIYKRDFLRKNKIDFLPTPGASFQDTGFNFKVWASARRAVFTNEAFLHYRHDNETASVKNPGKVYCVADEYREIETFLQRNNLTQELGGLAQATKYGAYSWNFKRLADGLDEDFLAVFSKEFRQAEKRGVLSYFYFDTNQKRELSEIISSPKTFIERKRAREKAKISIIVPMYNVAQYLDTCLSSLIGQTMKDIEIICINDGSTDTTQEIAEMYYKNDPRIILRDQVNQGLSVTRNHGMSLASAPFLMFCDADDSYVETACEQLFRAVSRHKTDIAMSGINIVYSSPQLRTLYRSDEDYYKIKFKGKQEINFDIINATDVSMWNKIFRTAIQKKYDIWFPKGLWYEDSYFFISYMLVSKLAYYLQNSKLYNYVRRENSIMHETTQKTPRALDHTKVMVELFGFLKKYDLVRESEELFIINFKRFYEFSKSNSPVSAHDDLNRIVERFLKNNKAYLGTTSPRIRNELHKLLPKVPLEKRIRHIIKTPLQRAARLILPATSPYYRRQSYIMKLVVDMHRSANLSSARANQNFEEIKKRLDDIEQILEKKRQ